MGNSSKSIAELLEERHSQQSENDVQVQLEALRDMILNADSLEAGVREAHNKVIEQTFAAIEQMNEDKKQAFDAVAALQEEKKSALSELNKTKNTMINQANEHMADADKRINEAVQDASDGFKAAHGQQMLTGITELGEKIDRLGTIQGSITNLNETMAHVLAVLQSPKVIEFDEDGMPIGVRTQ